MTIEKQGKSVKERVVKAFHAIIINPLKQQSSSYYRRLNFSHNVGSRGHWAGKAEFFLSCLGYAVGVGNLWRFPTLAYQNGGAAFLFPYMILQITIGQPMYLLELAMGQYSCSGQISSFSICPAMQGIGISMVVITATLSFYYVVIMAFTLHFTFASFTSTLPWTTCKEKWLDDCCFIRLRGSNAHSTSRCSGNRSGAIFCKNNTLCKCSGMISYDFDPRGCTSEVKSATKNASYNAMLNLTRYCPNLQICTNHTQTAASIYFKQEVQESTLDMNAIGNPLWDISLCLLLCWIVVVVCNIGGVRTSGKIVYFTVTFPYVMILVLLIRGSVLPGAGTGMAYYLVPDFRKLGSIEVWRAAAGQMFFSLGISYGVLINLGSFNTFQNNVCNDAIIVACADLATSFFAGLMVFTYVGVLSHDIGVPIDKVAEGGYGLVFVIYPEALAMLPGKHFWSVMFFLMLFSLGVDTEFALVEGVITSILDMRPQLRKYRSRMIIIFGCVGFLLGLPYTTPGGDMVLSLVDKFACTNVLFVICIMELITVAYIFGAEEFYANITYMVGYEYLLMRYWKLSWKYFSPIAVSMIFLLTLVYYKRFEVASGVLAPGWAEAVGWMIFFSVIAPIPLCFGLRVYKEEGTTWREKVKHATASSPEWHRALKDTPQITEKLENDEIDNCSKLRFYPGNTPKNTDKTQEEKKSRKYKDHPKASDLSVATERSTARHTRRGTARHTRRKPSKANSSDISAIRN